MTKMVFAASAFFAVIQFNSADDRPADFSEVVGNWTVAGDLEAGGCIMRKIEDQATTLTVLSRPNQGELAFAVSNPSWRSLKDGENLRLWAHFRSNGYITDSWNLAVTSYNKSESSPVLNFTIDRAHNDGASFVSHFSKASQIIFMRDKVPVALIDLSGSARAIDRLLACRASLRAHPDFDPFAE